MYLSEYTFKIPNADIQNLADMSMDSYDNKDKIVQEFQNFMKECQNEVTGLLEVIGWTPDHFLKQDDIVSCSFDNSHRMPRQCLVEHEEKCELLFVGYRKEDLEDVQAEMKVSENFPSDARVNIDKDTMNRILRDHHVERQSLFFAQDRLPLTQEEFSMQLTPAERASIYDYVINKVKGQRPQQEDSDKLLSTDLLEKVMKKDSADNNKPTSYIEYLKAQRDYKRRRPSYRAKNVHITKKSYTEIIREVIHNQTELLAEFRQEVEDSGNDKTCKRKSQHQGPTDEEFSDDSHISNRSAVKKKKKHKKHKSHKHKHKKKYDSKSNSRSRSRSESKV